MFRLASMPCEDTGKDDAAHYISSIASKTIYDALCRWCQTDKDVESIYESYFDHNEEDFYDVFDEEDDITPADCHFFYGIGQYFLDRQGRPLTDEAAGKEILYRKIKRMKEKMLDPDKYYTFDVFEEFIFVVLIDVTEAEYYCRMDELSFENRRSSVFHGLSFTDEAAGKDRFDIDETIRWIPITQEEKETADILHNRYGFDVDEAEQISMQLHRVHEMRLDDNEDDNLFFWDMDMEFLFQDGFVDGIIKCAGPAGTMLGYGYEYTQEIFTDMGMKPPARLLGSKAASEAKYEAAVKAMNEKAKELWKKD